MITPIFPIRMTSISNMSDSITSIDTLICARWLLPIVPRDTVVENHAIAISDGRIIEILPTQEATAQYQAQQLITLKDHILMPGLINAHGHAAMTLFRGMADDFPLMTWLENYIWPAEQKWVDETFVKDGTELAIVEMLRSGTTCFSDMYFFPNQAAEAAHQAGMRAQIVFPIFDMPSAWGRDANDYIHKGLQVRDDFKHSQFVDVNFGPHAPYTNSDGPLQRVAVLSEELDCPVQMHLHETAHEVNDAFKEDGRRPLQRMFELGLLSPRMQCVHMTEINDADLELLIKTSANVIHCPTSNLKLASGFCPVAKLTEAGINIALGTDGAASNNNLDLFSEMNNAALLAKLVAADATALPAHQALRMATINGARALGIEDRVGSLEAGKQADIIAIDLSDIESQPLYNPSSQLVYTHCAQLVRHVWIAGRQVLQDRQPCTLNLDELGDKARHWHDKISTTPAH